MNGGMNQKGINLMMQQKGMGKKGMGKGQMSMKGMGKGQMSMKKGGQNNAGNYSDGNNNGNGTPNWNQNQTGDQNQWGNYSPNQGDATPPGQYGNNAGDNWGNNAGDYGGDWNNANGGDGNQNNAGGDWNNANGNNGNNDWNAAGNGNAGENNWSVAEWHAWNQQQSQAQQQDWANSNNQQEQLRNVNSSPLDPHMTNSVLGQVGSMAGGAVTPGTVVGGGYDNQGLYAYSAPDAVGRQGGNANNAGADYNPENLNESMLNDSLLNESMLRAASQPHLSNAANQSQYGDAGIITAPDQMVNLIAILNSSTLDQQALILSQLSPTQQIELVHILNQINQQQQEALGSHGMDATPTGSPTVTTAFKDATPSGLDPALDAEVKKILADAQNAADQNAADQTATAVPLPQSLLQSLTGPAGTGMVPLQKTSSGSFRYKASNGSKNLEATFLEGATWQEVMRVVTAPAALAGISEASVSLGEQLREIQRRSDERKEGKKREIQKKVDVNGGGKEEMQDVTVASTTAANFISIVDTPGKKPGAQELQQSGAQELNPQVQSQLDSPQLISSLISGPKSTDQVDVHPTLESSGKDAQITPRLPGGPTPNTPSTAARAGTLPTNTTADAAKAAAAAAKAAALASKTHPPITVSKQTVTVANADSGAATGNAAALSPAEAANIALQKRVEELERELQRRNQQELLMSKPDTSGNGPGVAAVGDGAGSSGSPGYDAGSFKDHMNILESFGKSHQ
jgi:hypothetical protein